MHGPAGALGSRDLFDLLLGMGPGIAFARIECGGVLINDGKARFDFASCVHLRSPKALTACADHADGRRLLLVAAEAGCHRRSSARPRLRRHPGIGDTARAATSDEVKILRKETRDLKEVVAEQALELRLLKKSMIADGGDDE
jgi:hypothetical protein